MTDLTRKSASELVDMLASKQVSSVEVTQAHIDRTNAVDGAVHSYLHVSPESALATAAEIDRKRAAGEALHPLAGLPIAVKDNLTTTDAPTTSGPKPASRVAAMTRSMVGLPSGVTRRPKRTESNFARFDEASAGRIR